MRRIATGLALVGLVVLAAHPARGQQWRCTVRAFDGWVYSDPAEPTVTIQ